MVLASAILSLFNDINGYEGFSHIESGDDDNSVRSTAVGAGAALTFGDLIVEGTLTNVQNTAAANTSVGTNGFLSNVSVRYNW